MVGMNLKGSQPSKNSGRRAIGSASETALRLTRFESAGGLCHQIVLEARRDRPAASTMTIFDGSTRPSLSMRIPGEVARESAMMSPTIPI
jgi:hypothetical protein